MVSLTHVQRAASPPRAAAPAAPWGNKFTASRAREKKASVAESVVSAVRTPAS